MCWTDMNNSWAKIPTAALPSLWSSPSVLHSETFILATADRPSSYMIIICGQGAISLIGDSCVWTEEGSNEKPCCLILSLKTALVPLFLKHIKQKTSLVSFILKLLGSVI